MSLKNIIPKKMQTGGQTFLGPFATQAGQLTPRQQTVPGFVPIRNKETERTIKLPDQEAIDKENRFFPIEKPTPEEEIRTNIDPTISPYGPRNIGDQPIGDTISNFSENTISKNEARQLSSSSQNALVGAQRMSPAVIDALADPNKEPFGVVNQLLSKVSNVVGKGVLGSPALAPAVLAVKVAEKIGFQTEEEKEKSSLQRTDPAYFGGPIYQRQQGQANEAYVETFSFRDSNNRTVPQSLLNSLNTGEIGNTDYAYALEAHKQDITNVPGYYEGIMATASDKNSKAALGYSLGYTVDEGGRFSTTPNGMGGQETLDRSFSSRDHARAGISNQDIINLIHDGKTARGADKETITTGPFVTDINAKPLNQIEVSRTFDNVTPEEARDIIDDAVKDGATQGELNLAIENSVAAQNIGKVTGRQAQLNMGASADIDAPKVICAELYRQGLLEKEIFELDEEFGRHLRKVDPDIINGYHRWALPLVSLMQRSITVSNIIKIIAKPVVKHIAYQMGYPSKTYLGAAMFTVGKHICRFISKKDVAHA